MKNLYTLIIMLFINSISLFAQDPCTNITTISCGSNVTFSQSGAGNVNYPNNVGGCSSLTAQGGKEQIYQFTPTTTGTYEFNVSTANGGFVQYYWKQASLGCNNTAWNCIERTSTTGSIGAVNFTAGTSYLILLNSETTNAVTNVFSISCARIVCNSILPITCGTATTFSSIGYGDPNYPNNVGVCASLTAQGGKEQIYEFTPTTTGTYEFNISTANGGTVQYLWKQASLGCNNTAWNCIDRTSSTGSVGAVNFTAGTSYYIMLNSETPNSVTNVFTISCARIVCNSILPITCGTATSFSNIGYGDPSYPNNVGVCTSLTAQGGKEQIYEFTPTTTGTYEFNVSTANGGTVQYLWKQASLGCNNTAWNCINRTSTTGSIGAVNFTAGISYYIMLNSETPNVVNNVFIISCARVVCNSILPITCGTPTTFTTIGFGDPNYPNNVGVCTSLTAQGGKEQIYLVSSSTPYSINVTTANGGFVQYMWKLASLGCDNNNWNCLERKNSTGLVENTNTLPLNVPIYLLLNAESTSTVTNVFSISCTLQNTDFETNILNIYPNPAKSILNIQAPNNTPVDYVELIDLTGKVIFKGLSNGQLNVENLSNGVYFIKVLSQDKYYESKFVKE